MLIPIGAAFVRVRNAHVCLERLEMTQDGFGVIEGDQGAAAP